MTSFATVAYTLCALICAASAALLLRSWSRTRSRLVMWVAVAFSFLTVSNGLLLIDLFSDYDLSLLRSALIAVGLALLIYGVTWEEQR